MAARKTPILLRRSPLTDRVMALHRYTRKTVRGREVLDAGFDGKQDVTSDFDSLVCEMFLDGAPDICAILDGAAQREELTDDDLAQITNLRVAFVALIERHNARLDAS